MDVAALLSALERTPAALDALLRGLADGAWRWRPPEGGWSVLEVLGHLLAEESEDFRARLGSTLADPSRDWAPIDPERAVRERRMNEHDPDATLAAFAAARAESLAWLRGLPAPAWESARTHPQVGTIRAGDLLASWAAHDARHLAQVARRLHALAARAGAPFSVAYAG